jgi:hypothetical protein
VFTQLKTVILVSFTLVMPSMAAAETLLFYDWITQSRNPAVSLALQDELFAEYGVDIEIRYPRTTDELLAAIQPDSSVDGTFTFEPLPDIDRKNPDGEQLLVLGVMGTETGEAWWTLDEPGDLVGTVGTVARVGDCNNIDGLVKWCDLTEQGSETYEGPAPNYAAAMMFPRLRELIANGVVPSDTRIIAGKNIVEHWIVPGVLPAELAGLPIMFIELNSSSSRRANGLRDGNYQWAVSPALRFPSRQQVNPDITPWITLEDLHDQETRFTASGVFTFPSRLQTEDGTWDEHKIAQMCGVVSALAEANQRMTAGTYVANADGAYTTDTVGEEAFAEYIRAGYPDPLQFPELASVTSFPGNLDIPKRVGTGIDEAAKATALMQNFAAVHNFVLNPRDHLTPDESWGEQLFIQYEMNNRPIYRNPCDEEFWQD